MSFGDRYWNTVTLGPFNSDGNATNAVGRARGACIIKGVDVYNTANVATHATNYVTMRLLNLGTDASGTTVVATASTSQTGGSAVTAHVPFPLTVTAANATLADGEVFAFVRAEQNTDAANLAGCTVNVHLQEIGPKPS